MKSRILSFRSASCFVTRASLPSHHTERTFDVKFGAGWSGPCVLSNIHGANAKQVRRRDGPAPSRGLLCGCPVGECPVVSWRDEGLSPWSTFALRMSAKLGEPTAGRANRWASQPLGEPTAGRAKTWQAGAVADSGTCATLGAPGARAIMPATRRPEPEETAVDGSRRSRQHQEASIPQAPRPVDWAGAFAAGVPARCQPRPGVRPVDHGPARGRADARIAQGPARG